MNDGRTGRTIRDTAVMQAIDQLLLESPELSENAWLMHRKQVIESIEDEGERAPPLSTIFDVTGRVLPASEEHSDINLIDLVLFRLYFPVRKHGR
ncbi:MAG: hypothetical protein ACYCT2_04740 [Thermoplasmataceae archaeon]